MSREENKEETRNSIIESALICFANSSIENTSMETIAKTSKISTRTIYRYFETKEAIVLNAAYLFWEKEFEIIKRKTNTKEYIKSKGIDQLAYVLGLYVDVFITNKQFLMLAQEADLFLHKKNVIYTSFTKRVSSLKKFDGPMWKAVQNGLADGSIRNDIDYELAYRTMSSGLFGIMQKLAFEYHDIHLEIVDAILQLNSYCEIMLSFFRKK